ncbi:MAG: protein phosphatase 2C domain-containing protein [Aliarcobacter sp.]|nr:protein phosphatase 2C domain-containing protein [Aliarcobacter sp.]
MWKIVSASAKGNGHKECQDSYAHWQNSDVNITIVSDGAGSKKNSKLGSNLTSIAILKLLKDFFEEKEFEKISKEEWDKVSQEVVKKTLMYLKLKAKKLNIDYKSLGCTLIVNVYNKNKLLTFNIGDGRAGYKNTKGEWKSSITPFHGEEVGQTIFITSDGGLDSLGINYIEDEILSVVSLSDGMEDVSFYCFIEDKNSRTAYDKNQPYNEFFNPLLEYIKTSAKTKEELDSEFKNFLTNGTKRIEQENDDKTMIIGVLNEL